MTYISSELESQLTASSQIKEVTAMNQEEEQRMLGIVWIFDDFLFIP